MLPFPSNQPVAQQQKDDEPGRYGFGTKEAIEKMIKVFSDIKGEYTGLVAINLATLLRNSIIVGQDVDTIVNNTCSYMMNISQDLAAVFARWQNRPHHIIFYYANAEKIIPKVLLRQHNGESGTLYAEALPKLLERIQHAPTQHNNGTTALICLAPTMRLPSYKGLADICSKVVDHSVVLHLLSHQAIDWHIFRTGRKGILYRSHTGDALNMNAQELGPVAFGEQGIPFYPTTHIMLGDKNMIKGYLVRNERKQFILRAQRERFLLHSEMFVNEKVKLNKSLLPYRLD